MSESKISMSFPRDYYLECAEQFEGSCIDCVDQELSEFGSDAEDLAYELAYTRYSLVREEVEAERLRTENEALMQQAQIWKQEARTMQNTVAECYQAVTGSTGEPGDWNGAKPVREAISELKGELDRLQEFSNIVDGINPLTLRKAKILAEKGYRVAGFCLEKVDDDKCFIRHAHVTWVKDEGA